MMLLQPLRRHCAECAVHHKRNMREEQRHLYVARTSSNRVIPLGELYCCLLQHCEALRTCRSGFPITTLQILDLANSVNRQHSQLSPRVLSITLFHKLVEVRASGRQRTPDIVFWLKLVSVSVHAFKNS